MKTRLLTTIFLIIIFNGCSSLYIAKQGFYQLKLIYESEPIEIALRRPDLPQNSREKLKLILDVRAFAENYLHLNAQKNYKDVDLDYNVVVHTVSACESLAFKPYEWWFPILGSVPYKGFFDKKDADKEEARLKSLGYETQNRPIQGYSTLGFFADPIWPKMLLLEDFELVELIIHELTHATIYFPNQTVFNESLANFVGVMGTELYLKNKFNNDSQQVKNYMTYQENLKIYHVFFHDLYQRLENIYNSSSPDLDKKKDKEAVLLDAKNRYLKLEINKDFKNIYWPKINNAYLLSFKRYNNNNDLFLELFHIFSDNFKLFFDEIIVYNNASDPFDALKNRLLQLKEKP